MCSRQSLHHRATLDPTNAIIEPLVDAYLALKNKTLPTITRLESLLQTATAAPRLSVTTEAACLEALALIEPALTSTREYLSLYAPFFDAPDPIAVLRRVGVIFEGDENPGEFDEAHEEKTRNMVRTMARLARAKKACLERFEGRFRAYLERFRRRDWVSRQLDDMTLARHGGGSGMTAEDVEGVLGKVESMSWRKEFRGLESGDEGE